MSGPEFFQTRMGQHFYEVTMPDLVTEMRRLNDNLEAIEDALAKQVATAPSPIIRGHREAHTLERNSRDGVPGKTACGLDAAFLVTSEGDDGITCAECRDRLGLESKR